MNDAVAEMRFRDALLAARRRHASDLHLCAMLPPVARIDGRLETLDGAPYAEPELESFALTIAARSGSPAETGEFTTAWRDPDAGLLRVHVFRAGGTPSVAVRLLGDAAPPFESLAAPEAVAALSEREHGLVLFAGPTGSGKSTTMAALVERINRNSARRILTIEDPIEYRFASARAVISQRHVGVDTPDLASAIRGALRSDPDVVVVGELRDGASIAAALTAAETGHLIFATVHAGDAGRAIDRVVDAFESSGREQARAQLARVLLAVVCQRLVRRRAGGRRAAFEVLLATDAVRALVRDAKAHQLTNAIATGRQFGMQTLESHLAAMVAEGDVDAAEAARYC